MQLRLTLLLAVGLCLVGAESPSPSLSSPATAAATTPPQGYGSDGGSSTWPPPLHMEADTVEDEDEVEEYVLESPTSIDKFMQEAMREAREAPGYKRDPNLNDIFPGGVVHKSKSLIPKHLNLNP